jgi:hypothetical protein
MIVKDSHYEGKSFTIMAGEVTGPVLGLPGDDLGLGQAGAEGTARGGWGCRGR